MAEQKVFTLSQVAQHKSQKDCWIVINGRVLDVSKFLEEHPGGEEVQMELAGKEATKEFEDVGHSKAAEKMLVNYQVGVVQGHKARAEEEKDVLVMDSKKEEMSAFVIKDEPVSKIAAFAEFSIPLLVAGSYFGYQVLTRPLLILNTTA